MSRIAKLGYLLALFFLLTTLALRFSFGSWVNFCSITLALSAAAALAGMFVDRRMLWDFFTMRTTKHGLSMGATIVSVLVVVFCVNYFANRNNKSWDVTQERLNSLSEQSEKLLKSLDSDVEIKVFTMGPAMMEEQARIRQALALYQDFTPRIKVQFINPHLDEKNAFKYLNDLPDRENQEAFVFVEYKGRRIRIERTIGQFFDEAAITSALVKVTRQTEAKIYFVTGHGEKSLQGSTEQSLAEFSRSLTESSYKVESLSLIDRREIPADASLVAIIGPQAPYLETELKWLLDYAAKGGRLLVAVDPGQRHNLANLLKPLGVEFQNNFVLSALPMVEGAGPALVLGRTFDASSDITKSFPSGQSMSLFYLTSEVRPAPGAPAGIKAVDLVKSDAYSFAMTDLKQQLTSQPKTQVYTLAVSTQGTLPGSEKAFSAVVFGDSDFLGARYLSAGVNRDLAMNSVAWLTEQKDLISIRPKIPKGTPLILGRYAALGVILGGLAMPILLLLTSGVVWYRRRSA